MTTQSAPRTAMSPRKLIAIGAVAAVSLPLAVMFTQMLDEGVAREYRAACKSLRPTVTNPALGKLPAIAPNFKALDHTGKTVSLSDYRGKVVFVNFWATWCKVCASEKPGLEAMAKEMAGDDFAVLSLASDPNWDLIRERFPKGSSLEIMLDPPPDETNNMGQVARSFGIKAVPESFLIDREGNIVHYFINKRDWNSSVAKTCLRDTIDG